MNDIKYYETRTDLLKPIPKNLNIAEIDVFKGDFEFGCELILY